ncbi:hypothetical protein JTB14_024712 [Gonioctena quinquepunctata]|nr:hypothetical protein JTB14_024712 [Gonioctena quinquepunctata]
MWPVYWYEMSPYKSDNVRYWKYPIPRNSTEYKLLMRRNDSTEKTEWNQLYLYLPPADKKNEPTLLKGQWLIYNIAVCSSVLILTSLVEILHSGMCKMRYHRSY